MCKEGTLITWEHFKEIYNEISQKILIKHSSLSELNISLIKTIMDYLKVNTKLTLSSDIRVEGKKDIKMFNISQKLKVEKILINKLSKTYLDKNIFKKANIEVAVQNFDEKIYNQYNKDIILDWLPKLSIIDILFNCGKNSKFLL